MTQLFSNNGSTTTTALVEVGDDSVTVVDGSAFPLINGLDPNEYCMCTLEDNLGLYEVVKATARNGDVFSIERQQEGTTEREFPVGSRFELRATAGTLANFIQKDFDTVDGGVY